MWLEALESRHLLAGDWQHPIQPLDVNNDRVFTAFDALAGINRLNIQTSFDLGPRDPNSNEPYYDVNDDNKHTAFDVLPGINALNLGEPVVAAGLLRDTAPVGLNHDRVTSDPVIEGNVTFIKPAMQFLAWLDTPTTSPATDLTGLLTAGKFTLNQAALEAILGAPLTDGPHTLHLETVQGASPATSAIDLSFVLDRQPPAPFAITGPTGARNNPAQTIAWEASTGATRYELQITRQADGTDVVATFTTTGTTQAYTYPADGTYYTRVRAFDAAGNVLPASNQSLAVAIDTVAPGAFSITGPTGVQTSTTITLAWAASAGATNYRVALHSDSSLSLATLISETTVTGTTTQLTAPGNGTFYLGVWGLDAANNTIAATNNPFSFQVQQVVETVLKDWITDSACKEFDPDFRLGQMIGGLASAAASVSIVGNGQKLKRVGILIVHENNSLVPNGANLEEARWHFAFYQNAQEYIADPLFENQLANSENRSILFTDPTNSNYLTPVGTIGGGFSVYYAEVELSAHNIQTVQGQTHIITFSPFGGNGSTSINGQTSTLLGKNSCAGVGLTGDYYSASSLDPVTGLLADLPSPWPRITSLVTTIS